MNNVFDFKRFGNYFLYDLRNAKNNYALSLLICGLLPIALFVFTQLISLIFQQETTELHVGAKYGQLFVAVIVVLLGAGTKLYGTLTEKRAGSNFLMLPASTFEKWLSMGLIVCIVVPVVLFALQLGSDALMSFLFPNTYGERLLALVPLQEMKDSMSEEGIHINFEGALFLNWCESILVFTLGAICFKKSKVAKTLLCLFAFGFLLSTLLLLIFGHGNFSFDSFTFFEDPTSAARTINWTVSILYTLVIGGLLAGIYYRLRTLKH